jgi:two-component system, chemotaxis family, chemotaxis protein CheY
VRALIVDDSPIIRLLLQRILRSYGECEFAKDGQEAVDTYSRNLSDGPFFDLVCLDLGLPVISGADVLEKIRSLEIEKRSPVKARILVITASSELLQVDAVQRQGADGYLVKPIDRQKLDTYLKSFGFLQMPEGTESAESPIQRLETMCDMDTIPASVLARLIQRMAVSIGRQLSDISTKNTDNVPS